MSELLSSRRAALRSHFCLVALLLCALTSVRGVSIAEAEHEGRAQFKVVTAGATFFYDKSGGGFSRLLDRDGKDWISFRKEPLKEVPASAAAGFRGIPNAVFGKGNPDAGAGHPGFDQCESSLAGGDTIRTVSKSGRWAWTWHFTETNAVFTMEKADADHAWWFLYEGAIAGRWSPRTHYWGTDTGRPRREITDTKRQLFEQWRWAYFGDDQSPRVLLVAQVEKDELPDTLWFMGNTRAGLDASDGMVVFGFGRGPGGRPQLRGAGQKFVLGLVEGTMKDAAAHSQLAQIATRWIQQGQQAKASPPAAASSFKWVNTVPPNIKADPALAHGTFFSKANKADIGYFVALPRGYDAPDAKARRFPVIYYLHGGNGNEGRGVQGYPAMRPMLTSEDYPAAFFVVMNGGNPNYIDTENSKGGTGFRELVAHIDHTYRTIAAPGSRVMLGHSMGGRGTGRIILKYPELIGTGVAMSGGHLREKAMSETGAGGRGETKLSDPKDNSWDNATLYASRTEAPEIRLMVVVGDKDSNHQANLDWCAHLTKLKIPHELIVVPGAGHDIDLKIQNTDRRIFAFIADSLKQLPKN